MDCRVLILNKVLQTFKLKNFRFRMGLRGCHPFLVPGNRSNITHSSPGLQESVVLLHPSVADSRDHRCCLMRWRRSGPDALELGGLVQLDGESMMDYFQYPTVCLDDLIPKGQEVHQVTCHWDFFLETVGVSVREIVKED